MRGIDKLIIKSSRKMNKLIQLGFSIQSTEDVENLDLLDKAGMLSKLAQVYQKCRNLFTTKKFYFNLDSSYLINIISCLYSLDTNAEVATLLRRREGIDRSKSYRESFGSASNLNIL